MVEDIEAGSVIDVSPRCTGMGECDELTVPREQRPDPIDVILFPQSVLELGNLRNKTKQCTPGDVKPVRIFLPCSALGQQLHGTVSFS